MGVTLEEVAERWGLTPEGVDYALKQYQEIICEITHGMLSKLSYDAKDVLRLAQDKWCETCDLKVKELAGDEKDRETFTVIDKKTGKEADIERIALREKWAAGLIYCDMEGWAIEQDGSLILMDECGNWVCADRERFKVVWDD